jgi:pectin methylesterase-like acyl-CoA thioesterase
VYIGKLGNAYFYESIVAGQTDFLYGFGTLWIESSQVYMRGCGGGVTAWKGTNTTFLNHYGVYIVNSTLTAANSSIAPKMVERCALGRPWNSGHRSIFVNTYEDASIIPGGYVDWPVNGVSKLTNQTFMAEYDDFGPGFNLTGRLAAGIDKVLNASEYQPYSSPAKVFQTPKGAFGDIAWIDQNPSCNL